MNLGRKDLGIFTLLSSAVVFAHEKDVFNQTNSPAKDPLTTVGNFVFEQLCGVGGKKVA